MKRRLPKLADWFYSKRVFLFDLDGTLYLGNCVLPGARELIARLRQEHKKIFFFTNNSSRSEYEYLSKLEVMGFAPRSEELVMSTHTLISYLKSKKLQKVFLLGTPSMQGMLQSGGIQVSDVQPQAVVVGFDKSFTYEKVKKACRLIDEGLRFIVTHPDLYCPTEEGPEPDCGSLAQMIESVTKVAPEIVLGKPHLLMMKEVWQRERMKKSEMLVIGDRLTTDIQMGVNFGVDTLLVLTGETKKKNKNSTRMLRPTRIISGLHLLA